MPGVARRVLIVISSVGGGGAERVAIDLSEFLLKADRDVTLLTLSGDMPDAYHVPPGVQRERMDIRRPAISRFETARFTLRHLIEMRRRIRELRPDVVLSFMDQTNIRTVASLFGTGIPVVISERTHPGFHKLGKAWSRARRLVYPYAKVLVVQTTDVATWFRNFVPIKALVTIPNAVRNPESFHREAPRQLGTARPIILAMGRFTREKGFDLLLEAFCRSAVSSCRWRLIILGDGPERDALTRQAERLGIQEAVELPGHVQDVADWISKANLFVLSSRYEGFPNALLEAMQVGKACISFDCPSGPSTLIDSGHNGFLVPRENVEALSMVIKKLAEDEALCLRLAKAAMEVRSRFAPHRIYQQWTDVLDFAYRRKRSNLFFRGE